MENEITFVDGSYWVKFKYNPNLVDSLKSMIPYAGRSWDKNDKLWKVDPKYKDLLQRIFPDDVIPAPSIFENTSSRYKVDLRYLGQVKDRGNGDISSFGFSKGAWSVLIPEAVLKEWFLGTEEKPKLDTSSLYGILGVANFTSADEIKAGYRRMAKQWHPDVCREPDAGKVFMQIKEAYDTLGSPELQTRYDVGLMFELKLNNSKTRKKSFDDNDFYRIPLRCGTLEVEAVNVLGRLIVSKIYSWEDIVDGYGRTLVTSWIMGDDKPIEIWA